MTILFLLKPIADMFYQYQFLDVFLSVIVVLLLLPRFFKIQFCFLDLVVLTLQVLYVFCFLRDTSALPAFIKIESGFLLYFLGRTYFEAWDKYTRPLQKGYLIILIISIITLITGTGFKQWGHVNTFSGLYFFKTDMAAALAQCFILFSITHAGPSDDKRRYHKILKLLVLCTCSILILYTNARIYYFILVTLFALLFFYQREIKTGKRKKINLKSFLIAFFLLVVTLSVMNNLNRLGIGEDYLLVSFNDTSELFDASNTQGRSEVWTNILGYFFAQDFSKCFWGIDLVLDGIVGQICESHNLYIKVLFSIGYCGFVIFVLFIILSIRIVNKIYDTRLFFIMTGFLITYYLSGISYSTILSTQLTWLPMYFLGVCTSKSIQNAKYESNNINDI